MACVCPLHVQCPLKADCLNKQLRSGLLESNATRPKIVRHRARCTFARVKVKRDACPHQATFLPPGRAGAPPTRTNNTFRNRCLLEAGGLWRQSWASLGSRVISNARDTVKVIWEIDSEHGTDIPLKQGLRKPLLADPTRYDISAAQTSKIKQNCKTRTKVLIGSVLQLL